MEHRNWIEGHWVEAKSGETTPNRNPADIDAVIGHWPLSSHADARAAVDAAAAALPAWRAVPAPERAKFVQRWVALLDTRREDVARALTREEGKTLAEARGEVQKSIQILEFIAGEGRRMHGQTVPSDHRRTFAYTVRAPLGVVAVVTPWNFPVAIPCWKIAPALIAGNTVVFKPATLTPFTATLLMQLLEEADLPAGVVNMVTGPGGSAGDAILDDARVRGISFTGSNEVGTAIAARAASRLQKTQLEMGGKNPVVVLDDADLELAIDGCVQGAFGSTGQRCTATSRAIVVDDVHDAFVAEVVRRARALRLGRGDAEGVDIGPVVDESQMRTVLEGVADGVASGATLECGGVRRRGAGFDRGWFVEPAVVTGVTAAMRIAREELFGPVLCILRVPDLATAITVANDVPYGLSASIYTRDVERAFHFVDEIEAGIVHVNSPTVGGEAQLPFGGVKATGIGGREMGSTATDFFTEIKTVYVDYTGRRRATKSY